MRWHPDDDLRRTLEARFAERRIGVNTLRAALVHFVKRCLDTVVEQAPTCRTQLGKRLDDVFKSRFPQADETNAVYDRWPASPAGLMPVARAAGVSENTGSLEDYRIETYFETHPDLYPWNQIPPIRPGNDVSIHEPTVLDSFFYAAMRRMMAFPDQREVWPDAWPILKAKGSSEAVEYVIIRPCIEHSMLGVVLGRGGNEDLGSTLWGQTELSCNFPSSPALSLLVYLFSVFLVLFTFLIVKRNDSQVTTTPSTEYGKTQRFVFIEYYLFIHGVLQLLISGLSLEI